MPEIPDMQVFRSTLEKAFAGKKLKALDVSGKKKLATPPEEMQTAVEGTVLKSIIREGKELHFHFDNGHVLGIHLMLTGRFLLLNQDKPKGRVLFSLVFEDNSGFAVTDRMGQARIELDPDVSPVPDAISKAFTLTYLKQEAARATRARIKSFLLDQDIVRGIGNAYSDEVLWASGISPFSIAAKIPDKELAELHAAIGQVLRDAEKAIREQYPEDLAKEERSFLKVHNPDLKETEAGEPILIEKIDGRKTYYTAGQKLYS